MNKTELGKLREDLINRHAKVFLYYSLNAFKVCLWRCHLHRLHHLNPLVWYEALQLAKLLPSLDKDASVSSHHFIHNLGVLIMQL